MIIDFSMYTSEWSCNNTVSKLPYLHKEIMKSHVQLWDDGNIVINDHYQASKIMIMIRRQRVVKKLLKLKTLLPIASEDVIHAVFPSAGYHPLFLLEWFSAAYHGQTWLNYENLWRLTVDSKSSWRPVKMLSVAIHILSFYVLCMICKASSCSSICFQRLGFTSPGPPSTSSSHIHRGVLTRQVICRV